MEWLAHQVIDPAAPALMIVMILAVVAILMTEGISNAAAVAILLPIGYSLGDMNPCGSCDDYARRDDSGGAGVPAADQFAAECDQFLGGALWRSRGAPAGVADDGGGGGDGACRGGRLVELGAGRQRVVMRLNKAFTIWFTGLSGSGKSTIGQMLGEALRARGLRIELLDSGAHPPTAQPEPRVEPRGGRGEPAAVGL